MGKPSKGIVQLDIVIPVYGQLGHLRAAVQSILDTSGTIAYRVTIVDDASPEDGMDEYYDSLERGFEVLRNKENRGFPFTVNRGVAAGYAPLVLLMNSDIVLQSGCIQAMMDEFKKPTVGVVGAKLLFSDDSPNGPPGSIQHAGMCFNIRGQPFHMHIGWSADHPKVNERRDDLQIVTGALMMTRRSLWDEQKGVSEEYGRGTFEDMEFCIRVLREGNKSIVYQPQAVATHHVGASVNAHREGYPLGRNHSLFMLRNQQRVAWDEWKFGH